MKFIKQLLTGTLLCGIALAMVSNCWAENDTVPAKVVRIKGSARYTTDQKVWHPVEVNMVLKPGTTIQTGENSMVDIILGKGSVEANPEPIGSTISYTPKAEQNLVRLWENTTMALDKLSQMQMGADTMTDTELDLRAGRIFGTVKKMSATSKYEIKIPNGVAGIRGTIYMVSASGIIAVLQGSVMIAYLDASGNPVTQEVGAGFQFDTNTGQITPLADIPRTQLRQLAFDSKVVINEGIVITTDKTVVIVSPTEPNGNSQPPSQQNQ